MMKRHDLWIDMVAMLKECTRKKEKRIRKEQTAQV